MESSLSTRACGAHRFAYVQRNRMLGGYLSVLFALVMATPSLAGSSTPSPVNWSGAYLGATLGYGWAKPNYDYNVFLSGQTNFNAQGIEGGILGGYNFQTGNFVYGVEGDFTFTDINHSVLRDTYPCLFGGCDARIDWYGTLRGRLGYSFGNLMPFITGGLAFGRVKGSADIGACGIGSHCDFRDTRAGWTLGAGTEWKFNTNWSVKAEYLYVNLGKPHFNNDAFGGVSTGDIDFSNVRLGVSYHF